MSGAAIDDDLSYVLGLGLIRFREGEYEIANPMYREIIPRALTFIEQAQIRNRSTAYVLADGSLDLPKLMTDWQVFWRIDGHLAAEGFSYRESGPHLMLMAFLQRIVNGGGRVEREYGLGRRALDLLVEWRGARYAIETKLRRDTETEAEALLQITESLDRIGLDEGWLVLFDLRSKKPWSERLTTRTEPVGRHRTTSWAADATASGAPDRSSFCVRRRRVRELTARVCAPVARALHIAAISTSRVVRACVPSSCDEQRADRSLTPTSRTGVSRSAGPRCLACQRRDGRFCPSRDLVDRGCVKSTRSRDGG